MPSWPDWAWWVVGASAALAAFVAALPWVIRPLIRLMLWPRYSFRVAGLEHVPRTGPLVVASNHMSWFDGFFLVAVLPRHGKALVNASYVDQPLLRWLARRVGIIPVPSRGPKAQRRAIEATRAAFDRGEGVLIFPEAQLSRTGLTGPFFRGIEVMLKGRDDVAVVPVFLDNVWGSIFSHSGGKFLRKRPRGRRRTVRVAFGPPVGPPRTAFAVRQAVIAAGVRAAELADAAPPLPEPIDLDLPHWSHPELGLLAVSAPDFDDGSIRQVGQKPGTVGQAAPGVALRAVGDDGRPLGHDEPGRLQALLPGRPDWVDTGRRGALDRDGFVRLDDPTPAE